MFISDLVLVNSIVIVHDCSLSLCIILSPFHYDTADFFNDTGKSELLFVMTSGNFIREYQINNLYGGTNQHGKNK